MLRRLELAVLLVFAAGPLSASTFVTGTVFQLERGRPSLLAKVTVIARAPDTKEILATARTDQRGRFELRRDFSGKVSFSARKHGYFVKTAGGRPDSEIVLECHSASDCGSVDFEMGRAAVVTGRVVGEYGDPIESVEIVMKADDGEGTSSRVEGATQSDDRGLFRISGVSPGQYRLQARAGYVYGDNTQYRGEATEVEVVEGGFISGIRIVLAPVKRGIFHVSGKLTGVDLTAEGFHWVELRTVGSAPSGLARNSSQTVGPAGSFAFSGVNRGRYVLSYRKNGTSTIDRRMLRTIEVNSDISGLNVSPIPLTGVIGRIKFETPPPAHGITLSFVSNEGLISPRVEAFAPDFEFDERGDFLPGSYRVQVASRDYYLKELRERGRAISSRDFELRAGDIVQVEAVIADDFGYLHGRIKQPRAGEGEVIPGTHFRVGLKSEDGTRSVAADSERPFRISQRDTRFVYDLRLV